MANPPHPRLPSWLRLSLGGSAVLFTGMGIGRFSYTPMMPALIGAGALTPGEAGTVGAANLAGYLIGALAALPLARRYGEAPLLRGCIALALLCLIASIAPMGFAWLALWRGLIGVAMGVMMIHALALVTRNAPPERLGAATGIVFTGVGVAILLSGTALPELLRFGLAPAWAGTAAAGAVGGAVAFWGLSAAPGNGGRPTTGHPPPPRPPLSGPVLRLIAAQTMFSLGLIPHTIYWVDYLVRGLGESPAAGGLHWALFGAGAVCGSYLWGRLADRIGFAAGMVLVFLALAAGVALPALAPLWPVLVFSSLAVGAQPGFSAIASGRAHQVMGADLMPVVWRRMALVSGVCQAVGGFVYVALYEATGSHMPVFLLGGIAMAMGAAVSWPRRSGGKALSGMGKWRE